MAYFSMLNLHIGGVSSFHELRYEIWLDLRVLTLRSGALDEHLDRPAVMRGHGTRWLPPILSGFGPAAIFSIFLMVLPVAVFEFPYVFMLNYFHYGDLMFPVYQYKAAPISPTFIRNIGWLIAAPFVMFLMGVCFPYRFKYRFDRWFVIFTLAAAAVWLAWIAYPSSLPYREVGSVETPLTGEILTWPKQEIFPQTIYVFSNVSRETGYHERKDLDGWWQDDPPVHALNVLTKYLVYLAVGYAAMVRVTEKD